MGNLGYDFEGLQSKYATHLTKLGYEAVEKVLEPGDKYLAVRNLEPKIRTCKWIHPKRWVVPMEEGEYCYDTWECLPVKEKVDGEQ